MSRIDVVFRDEYGEFSAVLSAPPDVGDRVIYPSEIEREKKVARIQERTWELWPDGWQLILDLIP